jgi:hypothetical protein
MNRLFDYRPDGDFTTQHRVRNIRCAARLALPNKKQEQPTKRHKKRGRFCAFLWPIFLSLGESRSK